MASFGDWRKARSDWKHSVPILRFTHDFVMSTPIGWSAERGSGQHHDLCSICHRLGNQALLQFTSYYLWHSEKRLFLRSVCYTVFPIRRYAFPAPPKYTASQVRVSVAGPFSWDVDLRGRIKPYKLLRPSKVHILTASPPLSCQVCQIKAGFRRGLSVIWFVFLQNFDPEVRWTPAKPHR